jgi:hypothetical protein
MSLRRLSLNLHLSRTTVARKLLFLGKQAKLYNEEKARKQPLSSSIQFDDMETFEQTKCKPVSITLAVEAGTRRVLGFELAQMPANGPLAAKAREKYGRRKDQRRVKRRELLRRVAKLCTPAVDVASDQNPNYRPDVKEIFPLSTHKAHKGKRGCVTGQGELKKIGFDPLFSLNHTAAMFRANVNRLFRKTWCTTKKVENLGHHLEIYVQFHNNRIEEMAAS